MEFGGLGGGNGMVLLKRQTNGLKTYIPLPLERLQVDKLPCDIFVVQIGLVLLQQPTAELRILSFGYGVLDVRLLQPIQCDNYTVDLRKRIMQVSLRCCLCKLYLLSVAIC